MRSELILIVVCVALAVFFGRLALRSLRSGIAPWQWLTIAAGKRPITRRGAPLAYWLALGSTALTSIYAAGAAVLVILTVIGAFGPYPRVDV